MRAAARSQPKAVLLGKTGFNSLHPDQKMNIDKIIVNNQLISFSKIDNAGDKCLLFLHGWRSQKEVWQPIINKLQVSNNQLSFVSLDLPGFGASSIPQKPMKVGDYAEIVGVFIEKLDLKNIVIIGHSFGGRIGIKLAAKHPELISKLVLVDAAGFVTKGFKRTFFKFMAKLVKPFFGFSFTQGLRKKIYQFIGADDYLATPGLQKTFVNVVNEDLSEEIKKISCPTLIIWGEDDKETPVSFGEKMSSLIPNSKFIILPGSGHFSFLDKPEEFAEKIIKFIE